MPLPRGQNEIENRSATTENFRSALRRQPQLQLAGRRRHFPSLRQRGRGRRGAVSLGAVARAQEAGSDSRREIGVKLRPEWFGAIVELDWPRALVSVNRAWARRLGIHD